MREATLTEIRTIARRHLVAHGPDAVSLRAVARDMGMTAPGLYRYFSSLDDLLSALRADCYAELGAHVTAANAEVPADDVDGRVLTSLRAFRAWALTHRAEFVLLFGPRGPHQPSGAHADEELREERRFAAAFLTLFDQLLRQRRVVLPSPATFRPELREQLRVFAECAGFGGPNATGGALRVLASCWVRLYGLVCMEVFGGTAFAMDDMEPLFEAELCDMSASIGVHYRPPGNPR